jgi:hypothetical protein
MTSDEIEKRAAKLSTRLFPGQLGHAYVADDAIAQAMRELVAQAYEEATRAQCVLCAAGQPIKRSSVSSAAEWAHVGPSYEAGCAASRIHTLKDSLVQETVSS